MLLVNQKSQKQLGSVKIAMNDNKPVMPEIYVVSLISYKRTYDVERNRN